MEDFAVDVGEAEVAAAPAEGEALVVDAELVEDGGPEVVDGGDVGEGAVAEFVGGTVGDAAFDAGAGEPEAEAVGVVVAAVGALGEGGATEFAGEDDEGFFEEAAVVEIGEEGGDGLIDLGGHGAVAFDEVGVLIPGVGAVATADALIAAGEFDEADAAFDEASGDEALEGVFGLLRVGAIDAVEEFGGWGFGGDVGEFGDGFLHEEGGFGVGDRGDDGVFGGGPGGEGGVEFGDEVEGASLFGFEEGWGDIGDGAVIGEIEDGALVGGGEEGIAEEADAAVRDGGFFGAEDDVGGEIGVEGAAAVADPGAGAGVAEEGEAGVDEEIALGVLAEFGGHGADDGEVIGVGGDFGEEVGHFETGLAVGGGGPGGGHDIAVVIEGGAFEGAGHGLTVAFFEEGFGVKGIDMGDAAGHVEEDDGFGFGEVMEGGEGGGRGGGGGGVEEAGEGEGAEALGGEFEELAPIVEGGEVSGHRGVLWS